MKILFSFLCSTFLVLAISMLPSPASGACSFKKSLRHSALEFDVSSRPAVGCGVQVVSIAVRRGGRNFANLRADVDYLAENAWTTDLDGDRQPELVVVSRSTGNDACSALDVYYLEGNVILRSSLMSSGNPDKCKGMDRFHQDGRRIVRTIPLDKNGDSTIDPDAKSRTEYYEFSNGKLSLSDRTETSAVASAEQTKVKSARTVSTGANGSGPALTGITVSGTAIEINTDVPIGKFGTMKLNKPERLAIDFPAGSSPLSGKIIKIGNFGIKQARIGLNKGFVRIVLDSDRPVFPKYSITTSDSGMKIVFGTE